MRNVFQLIRVTFVVMMAARSGEAQIVFGVQPVAGYYLPMGRFNHADLLSTALPQQPSDLKGFAWGGDLQLKFRRRFAIEGLAETTTHTLPSCSCPGGPTDPVPVRVTTAAVVGQYDLSPRPSNYHLWAGVGPAAIRHVGRGYERPSSPVSWGGAFGLELTLPLIPHWDFVTKTTGVGYSFNLDFPPQHGPQLDVLLSIGARWHS